MSGDHLSWTSDENTVQARWTDILVERAAVERKWRGEDQKRDQTLHDWAEARRIFDQVSAEHPEYSKNKKIETTRDIYANGHRNRCPGVSSFKRQMKNWH